MPSPSCASGCRRSSSDRWVRGTTARPSGSRSPRWRPTARRSSRSCGRSRTGWMTEPIPGWAPKKPPPGGDGEPAPKPKRFWWRFALASVLIVAISAATTATAVLVYLGGIADAIQPKNDKLQKKLDRDLKVEIPSYGTGKFNEAYSYGGTKLTLRTVKDLTGLPINHVVNVDFLGFAQGVYAIGCVYADVDRRYYHSNEGVAPSEQYAEINVQPGYQLMCGKKALAYVRYRHTDTDIVRSAR